MNLVWGVLLTGAVVGVAVTALLLVRRRAPEGGYFTNGDRAAGVFGVLATGFSVLLGLVVFLAFSSYDQARSGAESEALLIVQQYETAQLMPPPVRARLGAELVCYGRSVVHQEWPRMRAGTAGYAPNPWGVALFRTVGAADPKTATEQSAYDKWLDRTADREESRRDRAHGAVGVIPGPLWFVLFFTSAVILAFMLFFADREERAVVQSMLIGSVVAVICAMLLLIRFLDNPLQGGYGGLRPVAMERTLRILDQGRRRVGDGAPLPCDERGAARS
jgi:amino acid transporter